MNNIFASITLSEGSCFGGEDYPGPVTRIIVIFV